MQVNFAHVCDYALVSQDGKLSVLGIFSYIGMRKLPARYPRMYLAFEIEVHPGEIGGTFAVRVEIVDQDGRKVFKAAGKLESKGEVGPTDKPRMQQVMRLSGLTFHRYGDHSINIFVNDELRKSVTFEVKKVGGAPPQQSPS